MAVPKTTFMELPPAGLDVNTCDTLPMDPDIFMSIPSLETHAMDVFPETQVDAPCEGIKASRQLPDASERVQGLHMEVQALREEQSALPDRSSSPATGNEISKDAPDFPGGPLPAVDSSLVAEPLVAGAAVTPPMKKARFDEVSDAEPSPAYSPVEASMAIHTLFVYRGLNL